MRIGVDCDGVLADFNSAFIQRVIDVTGKDLFPPRPFDIPTWNYPEHYGYSGEEVTRVWEDIKADPYFWGRLAGYETTVADMQYLVQKNEEGHEIYFITNRMGVKPKAQTEQWLYWMINKPTVLISGSKGLCAQALALDVYIDDKWENCIDVAANSKTTQTYIMDRPWNRFDEDVLRRYGIIRTDRVEGIAN